MNGVRCLALLESKERPFHRMWKAFCWIFSD
jgi:hypothetical protein